MRASLRSCSVISLWLLPAAWLVGCAALADPPEDGSAQPAHSPVPAQPAVQSVALPVANVTGRRLALAPDLALGLFEPVVAPRDDRPLTVADLIQAGCILALHEAGRHPAGMVWTNERVPDSPTSIEAAWRAASDRRLSGTIVWILISDWDDLAWRQRSIIRVSAEVVVFEAGRADSLRTRVFQRHPFLIPPLSTLAQAAGHIGMRMASEILRE